TLFRSVKRLALVGVVNVWQAQLARTDVFPDSCFGPVGDGKDADILAGHLAAVVQIPQLGALAAWVPAAEGIADGEDAFFRACSVFIAARATEYGVVAALGDGFYQRHGLQRVAGAIGALVQIAAVNHVLKLRYVPACAGLCRECIADTQKLLVS